MPDAIATSSIHLMVEGGGQHVPTDSGTGKVYRPFASGDRGGRVATLSTLWDFFIDHVPDPDEALAADPDFLSKLHGHPDVRAAMNKRETSVAGLPDRIEPNPDAPDKALARRVADYVDERWRLLPARHLLYREMQYAVLVGGVGHEWVWHRDADGVEYPVRHYPVDKSRFVFDRLGNMALLNRERPVWGSYVDSPNVPRQLWREGRNPPLGKFTYHVHKRRPGTWSQPGLEGYVYYGEGEDVALYVPVTFDAFVLRFRMKWLEKFGLPPVVLYHLANQSMNGEIVRICDSLRGESVITIPKGPGKDGKNQFYEIDQLDPPKMSYDAFAEFSDKWTKPRIDQVLLGSADENQKGETGGYSDHVSRQDSGPQIAYRWDAVNIGSTLNQTIIPAIALGRWPNVPAAYWPRLVLEPKEERDRAQEMDIADKASRLIPLAEDEVYERCGYRKPGPNEKTVGGPQQQPPPGGNAPPGSPGSPGAPGEAPGGKTPPAGPGSRAPVGQGRGPEGAGGGSNAKNGGPSRPQPGPPAATRTMPRDNG